MYYTSQYYPDLSELTAAQFAEAREFVVSWLQPHMPDVDLSPGTPTGDMVVTAFAAFVAANDEAHNRLLSDLNLANPASGIIWSCDYVTKYLGNFGVYDTDNMLAYGLVRLTFSSQPQTYWTLNRSAVFSFGGNNLFRMRVDGNANSDILIYPAGAWRSTAAPDSYTLAQTSSVTWAVDVPVVGNMTSVIAQGTGGTVSELPADLVGISAAIDFLPGVPSSSLVDLAKRTRKIACALTPGTRNGTRAQVLRNWPETNMVSPVITGDTEMTRTDPGSAIILQRPAMDIYVRSARDLQTEVQTVRLEYCPTAGPGNTPVFRGPVSFLHRPSLILSTVTAGIALRHKLLVTNTSTDILSPPTAFCGTRMETYFLEVTPIMQDISTPVNVALLGGGTPYALFDVSYLCDPLFESIADCMESPDNTAPGISTYVKSGPLSVISNLTIRYVRQPGVNMLLTAARQKISEHFQSAGYPDIARETVIHDIMSVSGAKLVTSISVSGKQWVSPATILTTGSEGDPDWSASTAITPTTFNTFAGMHAYGTGRVSRYACPPSAITFIEQPA